MSGLAENDAKSVQAIRAYLAIKKLERDSPLRKEVVAWVNAHRHKKRINTVIIRASKQIWYNGSKVPFDLIRQWWIEAVATGTHRLLMFLLILLPALAQATAILPTDRNPNWQPGIPGGIRNRTTINTVLGTSSTAAQINTAIQNCPSNQVVLLTNGTFVLTGQIFITNSGVTLRGLGVGVTTLRFTNVTDRNMIAFEPTLAATSDSYAFTANWTAGFTKGTTNITVASTNSAIIVGRIVELDEANQNYMQPRNHEGSICNYCSRTGDGERLHQQYVHINAISGLNLTIWPPLDQDWNTNSSSPVMAWWTQDLGTEGKLLEFSGVEDMSIDGVGSPSATHAVGMEWGVYACWGKNLEIKGGGNFAQIRTTRTACCEFRECYVHDPQSAGNQSYGMLFWQSTSTLAENNILETLSGCILIGPGSTMNVIAYNWFSNSLFTPNPAHMLPGSQTHDAHALYTLWEGNSFTARLTGDMEHGSSSHHTAFRNRIRGWEASKTQNTIPILFNSTNRFTSVIGNVLGEPGYHNKYECAGASCTGSDTTIYTLGYMTTDTSNMTGYDTGVSNTILRAVNWLYTNSPGVLSETGTYNTGDLGQTYYLTNQSYYVNGRPNWWGSCSNWPIIGPDLTVKAGGNPAQWRRESVGGTTNYLTPCGGNGRPGKFRPGFRLKP